MRKALWLLLLVGFLFAFNAKPRLVNLAALHTPAGTRLATTDASAPILPNGRVLTPRGTHVKVAAHPYGLALSPDGRTLAASCIGMSPVSLAIVSELASGNPQVEQIQALDRERSRRSKLRDEEDEEFRAAFMGIAIAPDNQTLYAAGGNQGSVFVYDLRTRQRLATVNLNDDKYKDSFLGALALTRDGKRLYVVDQANYRVIAFDTVTRKAVESLPTGRAPFAVALAPDERKLFVTNAGVFRYSLVEGYDPKNPKDTALTFPPYGFPSEAAQKGGQFEGKTVPGLGDPNDDAAASVWAYDVQTDGRLRLSQRTKTGRLIGTQANGLTVVGASSPSGIVAGKKFVFVSNANNDSVTVLDAASQKIVAHVELNLLDEAARAWRKQGLQLSQADAVTLRRLRGQIPFGLALSRDERRLYVTESGVNAVAVVDTTKLQVLGHIPTAWFPSQVAVSDDGKTLYVANAKGFGSGPNGGPRFKLGADGTYVGAIQKGVISVVPVPEDKALGGLTQQVLANNGFTLPAPSAQAPSVVPNAFGQPSEQIKHIVFITKENRTQDQVFGDISQDSTGRKLAAEASLALYGEKAKVFDRVNKAVFEDVNVSPNHHALARRFAFGDNFYLDADVSADGHRWLVGVYPNAWVETSLAAAYGGHRDFRPTNAAPGRLTFTGSSAALHPEDYLEAGSIWEHLFRLKVPFRNYGEGLELGGVEEEADFEPTGGRFPVNYPIPQPLLDNTARDFPTFNMNVSDVYRWEQFERDFRTRYVEGREPMPAFLNIYLPNDHAAKERPEDGYPYRASFIADNDWALGQMIAMLSRTPQWKNMAIFITEDDAQDGLDSIDAHRSLLMVVSPYARKGYAVPTHTSIASIFKTVYLLLGLSPLNQYDAAAADLRDAFTLTPDFTPYDALAVDARIFDPAKVRKVSNNKNGDDDDEEVELDAPADFEREHRRMAEQLLRK
jgi:YVTN family beta-propeller protein